MSRKFWGYGSSSAEGFRVYERGVFLNCFFIEFHIAGEVLSVSVSVCADYALNLTQMKVIHLFSI